MHHGSGARLGRGEEGLQEPERPPTGIEEAGAGQAGVGGVGRHLFRIESPRQLTGEENVAQLAVRVGAQAEIAGLPLQIIPVEPPVPVGVRAHRHHPRRRARHQQGAAGGG